MKRLVKLAGAATLSLIPAASYLAMFEVTTFPNAHHWMGYLIAAYLGLVLVLMLHRILSYFLKNRRG